MRYLLIFCALILFIALADLPSGYYTFLRIAVTIGAIAVIIREWDKGFTVWNILFGIIAILFNPIIPVYLYDKTIWAVIDAIGGVLFLAKAFWPVTKENVPV